MTFDRLDELFNDQADLQKEMGNLFIMRANQTGWQKYVNLMTLAMVNECMEMLNETAWKNPHLITCGWKKTQETDIEEMKNEIVDMWFFLLNLSLAAGFSSEELFAAYQKKLEINKARMEGQY